MMEKNNPVSLNTNLIAQTKQKICDLGALMFERQLTDTAGGNISCRIDDLILMTPRYAGSIYRWQLKPEQIIVMDLDMNQLEGTDSISREVKVHHALLTNFYPEGTAVVHGHAKNALVYCAVGKPIPSLLYATDKFGKEIGLVKDVPAHSQDLADFIRDAIGPKMDYVRKQAAAVLAPRHGVFVFGKNLDAGFDALERIDVGAYCHLMSKLL